MDGEAKPFHATTISLGGRGAMIRGPSGCGKSDLALRCLAAGTTWLNSAPARLIADDQTIVSRHGSALKVSAPDAIAGLLEVRGVGIVHLDFDREAELVLVVELASGEQQPRLPEPWPTAQILGLETPLLRLSPFEASAAARLLAALAMGGLPPVKIASA